MKLLDVAQEACRFIRNCSPNSAGLMRTERFVVKEKRWLTDFSDCDDFGDIAPFMAWTDMASKKEVNKEWVDGQFRLMRRLLMQESGFFSPYKGSGVRKSVLTPSYPLNNMDLLLGMNIMRALGRGEMYREGFLSLCDAFVRYAINGKGFVRNALLPILRLYYPRRGYLGFKPVASGVCMEYLADAFSLTGEGRYADASMKLAKGFTSTAAFRKSSLFADNVYPLTYGQSAISSLTKSNTSMANGLLRLFEVTGDEAVRDLAVKALEGIGKLSSADGSFYKSYDIAEGRIASRKVEKCDNQSAMDVLINAYSILGEKSYLERAMECAGFWMSRQEETGLFPEGGDEGRWYACNMDSHADITVSLSKIYCLKGGRKYKKSISSSASSFGAFMCDNGAVYDVLDARDGKPIEPMCETKMIGGGIKGMMTAFTVLDGVNVMKGEKYRLLTRDR